MARLIDADDVIKKIDEELALRCGYDADIALLSVKKYVAELPIAYNVEKVVKKLREVTESNVDIYENKEEGESWNDDIVSASEAIGIVRKGGVE